jgi:hypothetical protein
MPNKFEEHAMGLRLARSILGFTVDAFKLVMAVLALCSCNTGFGTQEGLESQTRPDP